MTYKTFRAIRDRLGLTQAAFAERIGVAERTVRHWEAGDRKVPEPVVRLLKTIQKP